MIAPVSDNQRYYYKGKKIRSGNQTKLINTGKEEHAAFIPYPLLVPSFEWQTETSGDNKGNGHQSMQTWPTWMVSRTSQAITWCNTGRTPDDHKYLYPSLSRPTEYIHLMMWWLLFQCDCYVWLVTPLCSDIPMFWHPYIPQLLTNNFTNPLPTHALG